MKERLDVLVFESGLAKSRKEAQGLILEGKIFVNGIKEDKCGTNVDILSNIELKGEKIPYVSRGGLKLAKALECFPISLENKICADIGASTGGFTDCMLQHKAKKVYAVDVGYGQLDYSLRNRCEVVNLEKTNARYITKNEISEELEFISMDVSFISITKIIPALIPLMAENCEGVFLIKPQFESEKSDIEKNGVIKDINTHKKVVKKVYEFLLSVNLCPVDVSYSPIKGPKGNIEYLIYVSKGNRESVINDEYIEKIVSDSHNLL